MAQQPSAHAVTRHLAGVLALALVVSLLVLGAGLFRSRSQATDEPDYGTTIAADGVLKRGCRTYTYAYEINPPDEGDWALETFIIGPNGKHLWSGTFLEGFDETSGAENYRLCRATTRSGIFRIKAKLTSGGHTDETFEVWLPVTKFRLRARH